MNNLHKLWLLGLTGCILVGCSGEPATVPVVGSVEFDGELLTHGGVLVVPEKGRGGMAKVQPDGSFVVSTFTEFEGDGALPGPAAIAVVCYEEGSSVDKFQGASTWIVPQQFANPSTSGLSCEIAAGQTNTLTIKVSSDGTGTIEVN